MPKTIRNQFDKYLTYQNLMKCHKKTFYVYEPKMRMIEASKYIDRIVHRWYVDYFLLPNFVPQFIPTTYACIKDRGMHYSALDLQKAMKKAKKEWGEYYILKMDIKKYFQNIDKEILLKILQRKIKDEKIIWLTKEIIYSKRDCVRNTYWKL